MDRIGTWWLNKHYNETWHKAWQKAESQVSEISVQRSFGFNCFLHFGWNVDKTMMIKQLDLEKIKVVLSETLHKTPKNPQHPGGSSSRSFSHDKTWPINFIGWSPASVLSNMAGWKMHELNGGFNKKIIQHHGSNSLKASPGPCLLAKGQLKYIYKYVCMYVCNVM